MFVKYEAFGRVMVVKYDTLKSGKCSKNYSKTITRVEHSRPVQAGSFSMILQSCAGSAYLRT